MYNNVIRNNVMYNIVMYKYKKAIEINIESMLKLKNPYTLSL